MRSQDILGVGIQERRKRRRFYFFFGVIFGSLYFIVLGASWIVLRSPVFHVQKIIITGNEAVATSDILSLLYSRVLRGKQIKALLGFNNILIWPEELLPGDLIFIPSLKSIKIEKNYRERSIDVTVEERKPRGIWCLVKPQTDADGTLTDADTMRTDTDKIQRESALSQRSSASDSCWWFDDKGIVFKRAIAAQGSLIIVVNDYSQNILGLNSKILPGNFIPNIFSIFRVLQLSSLNIKEISLRDLTLQEFEVDTYPSTPLGAGPKIYFSLRFPADNDLAVIENFAAKPGFNKLQYLDFRVENRVYYK